LTKSIKKFPYFTLQLGLPSGHRAAGGCALQFAGAAARRKSAAMPPILQAHMASPQRT